MILLKTHVATASAMGRSSFPEKTNTSTRQGRIVVFQQHLQL